MGGHRSRWQDGRRAWNRLNEWARAESLPDEKREMLWQDDRPMGQLADVRLIRGLLDEAELRIVEDARRHGKSWVEITTWLGVSREHALRKWQDVDGRRDGDGLAV